MALELAKRLEEVYGTEVYSFFYGYLVNYLGQRSESHICFTLFGAVLFFFFYGYSLIVCTFLSVNFSGKFFRCLLLAGFGQCCEMMAFLLFDVIFLFLLFYEFFCECYVRSPVQCFSQCIPDH